MVSLNCPAKHSEQTKLPFDAVLPAPQISQNIRAEFDVATTPTICKQLCQEDVEKFKVWSKNIGKATEGDLDNTAEYAAYIQERPA